MKLYKYVAIDHSIDKNYYGETLVSCMSQFVEIETSFTDTGFKLTVKVKGYKPFPRYHSNEYSQEEAEKDCLLHIATVLEHLYPNYSIYKSIQ